MCGIGIYRMSLGGWTAIPCGLATIVAGFIGAWLYEPKRRKIMISVVAIGIGFIGGIYRYSLGMEWSGALICILFVMFAGFLCIKGAKEGYRIKNLTTRQIGVVALITGIWECIHIDIFGPFLGEKAAAEAFSILTTHFLLPMTAIFPSPNDCHKHTGHSHFPVGMQRSYDSQGTVNKIKAVT
jgi:LytS/YehU family sensor histidine kinase